MADTARPSPRSAAPRPDGAPERLTRVAFAPVELRAAAGDGGPRSFAGHAIVYDEWTTIRDWWFGDYQERIAPGFARSALERPDDVRALINHDPNLVLARFRGAETDTLRMYEDGVGLAVEGTLPDTSYGRDLAVSLERGDVSGMSFAFEVLAEQWDERPDGQWLRTITDGRLFDVSIVTYPAYPATDAGLRSLRSLAVRSGVPGLLLTRAGRRNSAADEAVIRAAVDGVREHADALEGLIASSDATAAGTGGNEQNSARTARLMARRHASLAALMRRP